MGFWDFLVQQGIGVALALVVGFWLKNKTQFNNQAIPVFNFVLQFIGRLVLEIAPAQAGIFGSLKDIGLGVADIAFQSAISSVLASGGQSSAKATGRLALAFLKGAILEKLVAKLQKV